MRKVIVDGREMKVPRRFEKWPKPYAPCVRCQKASDEEVIEALTESRGNCTRAAAWLKENKGIEITPWAIGGRIKRNPVIAEAQAEILEAGKKPPPYKPCPACRKVSDELIIEALRESKGIRSAAAAWLEEKKGIKISPSAIGRRIKRNPALAGARAGIIEADKKARPYKPRPACRKVPDELIIEALTEGEGVIRRAAVYLEEKKGIKIDDSSIRTRVRKNPDLARTLIEIREKVKAEREMRPVRNRLPKKLDLPHGPAPKVPDNVFREAIRECWGNHYGMMRYIKNVYGIEIDRDYIRLRMDKHPEFRALKKEIREDGKDIAESNLMELVEKGDRRAVIYFLRTRCQDRGYGYGVHFERKEAEIKAREERLREREETLDACGTKTSLELLLDVLPQEEVTRILKILYNTDENGADHPADENLRAVLKKQSAKKERTC